MLIEAVGINPRRAGWPASGPAGITLAVYVFVAVCAGIAGLMISSNVTAADANNAGLWIELDAILAVVIGGTLAAGRPVLARRHAGRRPGHPDADHDRLHRRHPAGGHAGLQGRRHHRVCLLQSPRTRALLRRRRRAGPTGQDTGAAGPAPEPVSTTTATDSPSAPDAVGTSTTRNKVSQP